MSLGEDAEKKAKSDLGYLVGERVITTESGQEFPCDMVVFCTGAKYVCALRARATRWSRALPLARVNKASYMEDFAERLDRHGRLHVNEHLQVCAGALEDEPAR